MSWRSAVNRILAAAGLRIVDLKKGYSGDGLFTWHDPRFLADPRFRAAYARGVEAGQGVDAGIEWRVHVALWAATTALHVRGDFVECGVNAGVISSAILSYIGWPHGDRRYYLVDTFSGPMLSQFSSEEIASGRRRIAESALVSGGYVTDVERVRANFAEWRNVEVVQRAVPEALADVPASSVAFLHLDMNCAEPERAALEHFAPKLSPGAVVLLDDYAWQGHQAQGAAIDDAAGRLGLNVLALPTGQGIILR